MIRITPTICLSESEIKEQFVRAGGPGGQKVNKTETCVQLRFDARHSRSLSNTVFLRLKVLAGRRMTQDGVIVITADRFRTQERNRADARERLKSLISSAAVQPKFRRSTRPTKASKQRRLNVKRTKSNLKKGRGKVSYEE